MRRSELSQLLFGPDPGPGNVAGSQTSRIPCSIVSTYTDKAFLIRDHETSLKEMEDFQFSSNHVVNHTITPKMPRPESVLLSSETRIGISDLAKAGGVPVYGKFFLCRTIAPPYKIMALATVVEDPLGQQAVRLSLYNFVPGPNRKMSAQELQEILPVGTILAIKNPWLKRMGDGGLSIRSDNPGDVSVFNPKVLSEICPGLKWKGEIPSKYCIPEVVEVENNGAESGAIDFKRQGNIHFVKHKYLEAVQQYTNGINENKSPAQDRIELFSNRAAAFLKLEKFQLALSDCENALLLDSTFLKAQYRNIQALWGLGKYEDAHAFSLRTLEPALEMGTLSAEQRQDITELLLKAKRNFVQSKLGEYDMADIVEATENKKQLGKLDWAEFRGAIKIQSADNKGRGIFATQEFQPGQLIMASRAFASILDEGKESGSENKIHMNFSMEDRIIYDSDDDQLVTQIAHILKNNPEKAPEFYSLFAGSDLGHLEMKENDASSTYIDLTRIRKICYYNPFAHIQNDDHDNDVMPRTHFAKGLWILPSFLNHSCVDNNARWSINGDFLFVRAIKRILPGEEILIPYQCPSTSFEKRRKYFSTKHFQCHCRLCALDEQDSEETRSKIAGILNEFKQFSVPDLGPQNYPEGFEKSTKNYIKMIKATRPNNILLNPALFKPLDALSQFYYQNMEYKKCINVLQQLHSMETEMNMSRSGVGNVTNILGCIIQHQPQNHALVNSWIRKWKETAVRLFGTAQILPVVVPATLRKMKELGYTDLP